MICDKRLVWESKLTYPPKFQQGGVPSEDHSLVTAKRCQQLVNFIAEQQELIQDLLQALHIDPESL